MTSNEQVLNTPMDPAENDAGASTIREYLVKLLAELWREQEGFSGKRPFGNSSWDGDLYIALIRAGLIHGGFDEDGYLYHCGDAVGAFELIAQAIQSLQVSA